jgi:hypothetical protein
MARTVRLLAFFVLVGLAVTPSTASACSCMASGPACQAFWKTDAVFDATVDGIEAATGPARDLGDRIVSSPEKRVRMTVRQALKGVTATGPLDVYTAEHDAACGYDFKPGHRYLVFAWKRPADGRWVASICSATQEYDGTGETAAFIASLTEPGKGGRVFGTVRTLDKSFDYQHTSTERRLSAKVRLVGAGRERLTTSTNGAYEIRGLEPGRYQLEVEPPAGYASNYTSRNVDIPNERACQEETFHLAPAGRVTGVVLAADDRPAVNVQIELTTPETPAHPTYGLAILGARTGNDGTFEIAGVPPGKYILGVNLKDLPSQYNPYARTVYPSDGSGDGIVQIGTTGSYDIGTWKLPPPLRVVKVSGVATWADGKPAAGMYVGVWDVTGNPVEWARGAGGAQIAADGTFTIELREGRTYTFMARDKSSRLLDVKGPRLSIAGLSPPPPVSLILQNR